MTHTGAPLLGPGASAKGHQAAREANRQRGALLTLLAAGKLTLPQTIATARNNPRLKKIRLTHLLDAAGYPKGTANRIIAHTIKDTGGRITPGKATIGWLTDPRTKGVRILAFAARLAPTTNTPWPGWPILPKPEEPTL